MRYPNLTAEYEAGHCHIRTLCKYANVTTEIMNDILYGDEKVTLPEAINLHSLFLYNSGSNHCSIEYLFFPVLSVIDPETNKGKVKRMELRNKIDSVIDLCLDKYFEEWLANWIEETLKKAWRVLYKLENDKTITYAEYRYSNIQLDSVLAAIRETQKQPRRDRLCQQVI